MRRRAVVGHAGLAGLDREAVPGAAPAGAAAVDARAGGLLADVTSAAVVATTAAAVDVTTAAAVDVTATAGVDVTTAALDVRRLHREARPLRVPAQRAGLGEADL